MLLSSCINLQDNFFTFFFTYIHTNCKGKHNSDNFPGFNGIYSLQLMLHSTKGNRIHTLEDGVQRPWQFCKECTTCGKVLFSNTSWFRHVSMHRGTLVRQQCPACPYSTVRADNLKVHMWHRHQLELKPSGKRGRKKYYSGTCSKDHLL